MITIHIKCNQCFKYWHNIDIAVDSAFFNTKCNNIWSIKMFIIFKNIAPQYQVQDDIAADISDPKLQPIFLFNFCFFRFKTCIEFLFLFQFWLFHCFFTLVWFFSLQFCFNFDFFSHYFFSSLFFCFSLIFYSLFL